MLLRFRSNLIKKNYNKENVQNFLDQFTLKPCPKYPLFKENNCTNFVCQALYEGGITKVYGSFDNISSWFCSTTNSSDLEKISLSWRAARSFRAHFKNNNRCTHYEEITLKNFLTNYNYYCNFLSIGSIIQYIDLSKSPFPYHSQVIYNITKDNKTKEIFICQNTRNLFNHPLSDYLSDLDKNKDYLICLYKFD